MLGKNNQLAPFFWFFWFAVCSLVGFYRWYFGMNMVKIKFINLVLQLMVPEKSTDTTKSMILYLHSLLLMAIILLESCLQSYQVLTSETPIKFMCVITWYGCYL